MIDDSKKQKAFATHYDGKYTSAKSPEDIANEKYEAIFDMLGAPLKRMEIDYAKKVEASCYKDKHMSDDAPNEEQVIVCKDRFREKIFGKFYNRLANVRESSTFKYTDCLNEAKNDIFKAVHCTRNYISAMETDNAGLVKYFESTPELSKYLWALLVNEIIDLFLVLVYVFKLRKL